MKVVLVYPNQDYDSFRLLQQRHRFYNISPRPFPMINLGMLYLYSSIKDVCDVVYVDNNVHKLSTFDLTEWIKAQKPDVVAFGGTLTEWTQAKDISAALREWSNEVITVYGGPNATANPKKHVKYFDFILRGWAEETFKQFLLAADWPTCVGNLFDIVGLCFKEHIVPAALTCDIDKLKYPARDQVDLNSYKRKQFNLPSPTDIVVASRGCPYSCKFCSSKSIFDQRYKMRKAEDVVWEIKYMQEVFGTKTIHFREDNLTVNKTYLEKLCRGLQDTGVDWICQSHVNAIDKETVLMMKKAGCKVICCGFESSNDSTLDYINKGFHFEDVCKAISTMEECGILYSGGFMVGVLNEGENEIRNTLQFVQSIQNLKHCRIPRGAGRFVGWPTSPLYDEMIENNLVVTNWQDGECLIPNTYQLSARQVEDCIAKYS